VPYPAVTFAEILSQSTRQELEFFVSLLQGYLSQEHDENGRHTDITADSLVVDEAIEAGGEVSVSDGSVVITEDAGDTLGGAGGHGPGVKFNVGATATPGEWHQFVDTTLVDNLGLGGFFARHELRDRTVGGWRYEGSEVYAFVPGEQLKETGGGEAKLGSDADGSDQGWWNKGYIETLYLGAHRTTAMGVWTTVAYNAANFTADSGSWTVDDADEIVSVVRVDDTMIVSFRILTSDVSATPADLMIAIPGGLTAVRAVNTTCIIVNAGGNSECGQVRVNAGETVIRISRIAGAGNFSTTAADNTSVVGQITFEV
jgi:hypothetical protein